MAKLNIPKARVETWKRAVDRFGAWPVPTLSLIGGTDVRRADHLFSFFSSIENLRQHIGARAGYKPNKSQATEIVACLSQGHELLGAASKSGAMSEPILAFYGMHALVKGLVLSYGRPKKLTNLKGAHGLRDASGACAAVEDLEVAIESDGLFQRLLEVTCDTSGFRFNTNWPVDAPTGIRVYEVAAPSPTPSSLLGFKTSLLSLLQRRVGLESFLEATMGVGGCTTKVEIDAGPYQYTGDEMWVNIHLPGDMTYEQAESRHPQLEAWYKHKVPGKGVYLNTIRKKNPDSGEGIQVFKPLTEIAFRTEGRNGEYILGAFEDGQTLPLIAVDYMITFLLSSLARYRPDVWSLVVSGTGAPGRLRAVLSSYLDIVLEAFPLTVLALIVRSDLSVGRAPMVG